MIGEKIKNLRNLHSLTAKELADKMSVPENTIHEWESNTVIPSINELVMLIEVFGVTADEIIDDVALKSKVEAEILARKADEAWNKEHYDRALDFARQAIMQDDSNGIATYIMGNCFYFYYCHGLAQSYEDAVDWYKVSAENGYSRGQYMLGFCYYYGHGVDEDYIEAVKWLSKAAEQGDYEAQYKLAKCFANGYGVEEDYAKALEWYIKADENGYSPAAYEIAQCYFYGDGTEQDYKKAVEYYLKAANLDNMYAFYQLGICYEKGYGVEKNIPEAIAWYSKSAELGDTDSTIKIKRLKG